MGAVTIVGEPQRVEAMVRGPRLRLLEALRERPDSAAGLSARLGLPRQTLNYHLRELERAGLLVLVEERGVGSCVERVLTPTADVVGVGDDRTERDRASARYLVGRALDLVRDAVAIAAQNRSVATLTLESEIRFRSAADRSAFAGELAAAVQGLAAKYHDEHEGGGRRFTMLVAVHPRRQRKE